jgi:Kef-type K+ transport system membrane component KefB
MRRIIPYVLYALAVVVVVAGFLVIRSWGEGLTAPGPLLAAGAGKSAAPSHAGDLLHVLLALAAVVGLARILGTLFRTLGQPPVIGEIIAGVVLGPSLLGRVAPGLFAYVFPATVPPALNILSQVGVILFMFLVGVELDLGLIRRRGHSTVAISHASILAPFILGATLALLLYPRLSSSNVSFTNFALFLGVSMSITAFPVLARILTDRRISKTRMGTIALTCAAVDDVTAWCLLAVVVGIAQAQGVSILKTTIMAAGYILVMVIVVRPLMARLTLLYGNKGRLTQGLMATVFVFLLMSSCATEFIGIHAIFGAFALGAMIPHDSGLARELTDRLEDLVVALMLPAFFAFTGLRTQMGLLNNLGQWELCALIIVVASVGKFGGSLVAARLTGLGWRDGSALGVLMNTRGLMELIVLNIGFEMHIISPTLFAMMVIMALVTTLATTPILHLIVGDEQERAQAPVAIVAAAERSGILVPVANPAGVARLVNFALAATPPGMPPPRVLALVRRPAGGVRADYGDGDSRLTPRSPALSSALELAWNNGSVITPQAIWSDDPAADLVRIAAEAQSGWVLLGPHQPIFGEDFKGGLVRTVLERARELPLSVAIAQQDIDEDPASLLVIADGGPDGRAAVELGARVAQRGQSELHVMGVVWDGDQTAVGLSGALAEAARVAGRRLHTEVINAPDEQAFLQRIGGGLVIAAASVMDRVNLSRRGLAGRGMILVQGSRFASSMGTVASSDPRSVAS